MDASKIRIITENFRAIASADIVIDGITVVSGENGCGKSTLSKLLYYSYKISSDYEVLVRVSIRSKLMQLERFLSIVISELDSISNNKNIKEEYNEFRELINETRFKIIDDIIIEKWILLIERIQNNYQSQTFFLDDKNPSGVRINKRLSLILDDILKNNGSNKDSVYKGFNKIIELIRTWYDTALEKIKSRPADIFFQELYNCFPRNEFPTSFKLLEFDTPIVSLDSKTLSIPYTVQNTAYIDSPMILGVEHFSENNYWDDLNTLLHQEGSKTTSVNIQNINSEIINGDISVVDETFSSSDFRYTRKDGFVFDLFDCATGIKSFAMIQLLLKNGTLTDKSLLIIDEPEAHLHPQWIIEYARLIVLLNKQVGVNFFIASHNPDMVSAIKYISEKEGVSNNLNYYLAEKVGNSFLYQYKHLGKDIEPIFASFNIAIDRIDKYSA